MTPKAVELHDLNDADTEALFRRAMAYAADRAWELGAAEAVLAALYDVLNPDTGASSPEPGASSQ